MYRSCWTCRPRVTYNKGTSKERDREENMKATNNPATTYTITLDAAERAFAKLK